MYFLKWLENQFLLMLGVTRKTPVVKNVLVYRRDSAAGGTPSMGSAGEIMNQWFGQPRTSSAPPGVRRRAAVDWCCSLPLRVPLFSRAAGMI